MGVYDLSLLPRPSFPCLGGYVVGALWILVPSRVDTTYIPTQPRHSSRDTRTACNSQDLLGPYGHLVEIPEVGKQSMEMDGRPSSATGRLGPEITSASRKIISICSGQQSWPAGASAYRNQRLAAQSRQCTSPSGFISGEDNMYLSTHLGRQVFQPASREPGLCC